MRWITLPIAVRLIVIAVQSSHVTCSSSSGSETGSGKRIHMATLPRIMTAHKLCAGTRKQLAQWPACSCPPPLPALNCTFSPWKYTGNSTGITDPPQIPFAIRVLWGKKIIPSYRANAVKIPPPRFHDDGAAHEGPCVCSTEGTSRGTVPCLWFFEMNGKGSTGFTAQHTV